MILLRLPHPDDAARIVDALLDRAAAAPDGDAAARADQRLADAFGDALDALPVPSGYIHTPRRGPARIDAGYPPMDLDEREALCVAMEDTAVELLTRMRAERGTYQAALAEVPQWHKDALITVLVAMLASVNRPPAALLAWTHTAELAALA